MRADIKPIKFDFSKREIDNNHNEYLNRLIFYNDFGYDHKNSRENIIKSISTKPESILEIASGKGYLTILLAKLVEKVVSTDLDEGSLRYAAMNAAYENVLDKIELYQCDANKLPFKDGAFDLVISSFAFHHFKDPFDILLRMIKLAKKEIIITDFNKNGFDIIDKVHEKEGRVHHQLNEPYFDSVGAYLEDNGLKVVEKSDKWQKMYIGKKIV